MIIRIQGEGQYRLSDSELEHINRLDAALEAALQHEDGDFTAALAELLEQVRTLGEHLADEELLESDVILPPGDSTAEELHNMLGDDGLVPG